MQIDNDIWTFDLAHGTLTRLTFEREEDETPMWAPDGAWIAYASTEDGRPAVFRRRADGTGLRNACGTLPILRCTFTSAIGQQMDVHC